MSCWICGNETISLVVDLIKKNKYYTEISNQELGEKLEKLNKINYSLYYNENELEPSFEYKKLKETYNQKLMSLHCYHYQTCDYADEFKNEQKELWNVVRKIYDETNDTYNKINHDNYHWDIDEHYEKIRCTEKFVEENVKNNVDKEHLINVLYGVFNEENKYMNIKYTKFLNGFSSYFWNDIGYQICGLLDVDTTYDNIFNREKYKRRNNNTRDKLREQLDNFIKIQKNTKEVIEEIKWTDNDKDILILNYKLSSILESFRKSVYSLAKLKDILIYKTYKPNEYSYHINIEKHKLYHDIRYNPPLYSWEYDFENKEVCFRKSKWNNNLEHDILKVLNTDYNYLYHLIDEYVKPVEIGTSQYTYLYDYDCGARDLAKIIRKYLKEIYPDCKFKVKSEENKYIHVELLETSDIKKLDKRYDEVYRKSDSFELELDNLLKKFKGTNSINNHIWEENVKLIE